MKSWPYGLNSQSHIIKRSFQHRYTLLASNISAFGFFDLKFLLKKAKYYLPKGFAIAFQKFKMKNYVRNR